MTYKKSSNFHYLSICRHVFMSNRRCIDDWFKRSRTCPEHPEQPAPPPAEEEEEGESEEKPELTSSFEP